MVSLRVPVARFITVWHCLGVVGNRQDDWSVDARVFFFDQMTPDLAFKVPMNIWEPLFDGQKGVVAGARVRYKAIMQLTEKLSFMASNYRWAEFGAWNPEDKPAVADAFRARTCGGHIKTGDNLFGLINFLSLRYLKKAYKPAPTARQAGFGFDP